MLHLLNEMLEGICKMLKTTHIHFNQLAHRERGERASSVLVLPSVAPIDSISITR